MFSLAGVRCEEHSNTAIMAWACPIESIVNHDLIGGVLATKSPGAGWTMLCEKIGSCLK